MKDKNIYSSSAFMLLLRKKYNLNLLDLMFITNLPIKTLYEIQRGETQLGEDAYIEIQMEIPDVEECDFNGRYGKNKELR